MPSLKQLKPIFCYLISISTIVIMITPLFLLADVPPEISYQGRLTDDASGEPIPDGSYEFVFRLYDTPSSGAALWTETHTGVQVSDGLYYVMLGSITSFESAGLDFSQQYYLSIEATGGPTTFGEMSDRYQLGASDGQVLKWDSGSSKWTPANDATVGGGGVGGSGTDNYIPRWDRSSNLENSSLYQAEGGNFGIGTTTPSAHLEIEDAPGTGIIIDDPTMDGIYIESPTNAGVHITGATNWTGLHTDSCNTGAYIDKSLSHGIVINEPTSQGIYINAPGASGWGAALYDSEGPWVCSITNHGGVFGASRFDGNGIFEKGKLLCP